MEHFTEKEKQYSSADKMITDEQQHIKKNTCKETTLLIDQYR